VAREGVRVVAARAAVARAAVSASAPYQAARVAERAAGVTVVGRAAAGLVEAMEAE